MYRRRNNALVGVTPMKRVNKRDGGKMLRIPPHPTEFVSCPWFNLTVRAIAPVANFTVNALFTAMNNQLNDQLIGPVAVRLQHVKVWGALTASTAILQPITMIVIDPIGLAAASGFGTGPRVLEQITDFPDQVSRSRVGYEYPKAQREFSLLINSGAGGPNLLTLSGVGTNSVLYMHLQWRTFPTTAPVDEFDDLTLDEDVRSVRTPVRRRV